MEKCSCCDRELNGNIVKKYTYSFCPSCSIKIFDKLALVESNVKLTMEKVRKELK